MFAEKKSLSSGGAMLVCLPKPADSLNGHHIMKRTTLPLLSRFSEGRAENSDHACTGRSSRCLLVA
jgi:hypothetical protein